MITKFSEQYYLYVSIPFCINILRPQKWLVNDRKCNNFSHIYYLHFDDKNYFNSYFKRKNICTIFKITCKWDSLCTNPLHLCCFTSVCGTWLRVPISRRSSCYFPTYLTVGGISEGTYCSLSTEEKWHKLTKEKPHEWRCMRVELGNLLKDKTKIWIMALSPGELQNLQRWTKPWNGMMAKLFPSLKL